METAAKLRATDVHCKLWLERDGRVALSDWRVELLEAIDETGSLVSAARAMNVPYRTAWYKLKEIEQQLGLCLLRTRSGGTGGGGSALTPEAREIISRFRRVYRDIEDLVRQRFEREFA